MTQAVSPFHRVAMISRFLLLLLLVLPMLAPAAGKPNILFLFADDMRADSIAALGNPVVKTPHLDSLVQRGFAFNNAYCLGGNSPAVCTPARNMLLSGNVYFRWRDHVSPFNKKAKGMLAPGDGPNFPLSMQEGGYFTYHQGKKGNTALEIQARFQSNKYINEDLDRTCGEPGKMISDDVITFLKQRHEGDAPFFMYLAFANPHDPRVAAGNYMGNYQRDSIPLPKNYLPQHPFDNGDMTVRDEKLLPWPRTEDGVRGQLHEYYAVITALDGYIGKIIQTLKEQGLYENTIIVFSADQGIAIGSHGLLGKQNLYDAGMKVPLVFAGPGIPHGRSDALVYLHDIYPTVCDLAGVAKPSTIDGRSFQPVIAGQAKTVRQNLFFSYMSVQRAYRDERWMLIRYPQVNVTQLFDLAQDPDEMHDLSAEPAQAQRISAMMASLHEEQTKVGDTLPLEVANPKPAAWTPPTNKLPAGTSSAAAKEKE